MDCSTRICEYTSTHSQMVVVVVVYVVCMRVCVCVCVCERERERERERVSTHIQKKTSLPHRAQRKCSIAFISTYVGVCW
jgi:hypothetical protein